jgi:hypothetical protein
MEKVPAPPALAAVFRLLHLTEPLLRRAPADVEKADLAREAIGAVKGVKGITRMKRATRVSRAAQCGSKSERAAPKSQRGEST